MKMFELPNNTLVSFSTQRFIFVYESELLSYAIIVMQTENVRQHWTTKSVLRVNANQISVFS